MFGFQFVSAGLEILEDETALLIGGRGARAGAGRRSQSDKSFAQTLAGNGVGYDALDGRQLLGRDALC